MAGSFSNFQDLEISHISTWSTPVKVLGLLLIGLLILFLMHRLFHLPALSTFKAEQIKEKTLKTELEQKQAFAANLPAHKAQMADIKNSFETLLKQLPDTNEVPRLLADISRAGADQGVVFKLFKPSQPEQQNFFTRLPIEIEASGTYHQIARFITEIANFRRVVSMGEFTITRSAASGPVRDAQTQLTIKAEIYTYHFSNAEKLEYEQTTKVTRSGVR